MITHLISTTEFVKLVENKDGYFPHERYTLICNYANFNLLKPELWMFIPCDEEGNVLEEPKIEGKITWCDKCEELNPEYGTWYKAQSKVLFKGWKYELNEEWDQPAIVNSTHSIILGNTVGGYKTIEKLASKVKLELTETALKQIGL